MSRKSLLRQDLPAPPRLTRHEREVRLEETRVAIQRFLEEHKSGNSERAYYAGLRYFWAWCWFTWGVTREEYPVPENIIEAYVLEQLQDISAQTEAAMLKLGVKRKPGRSKLATVEQRLWALNRAHQEHVPNIDDRYVYTPTVRKLLKAARQDGYHQKQKSTALVRDLLERLIDTLDNKEPNYACMMRALLSVGFAAGGRRVSELVSMREEHLKRSPDSTEPGWMYELALGKRKTAAAAEAPKILPVRGMAARYLAEWIELRRELGVENGPLFRAVRIVKSKDGLQNGHVQSGISTTWIWNQLKQLAEEAGIDGRITPHSLRSGYSTQAVRDGISISDAMAMTDHKSFRVFMGYVEAEDLLHAKAGKLL